jgi:hypothetical protein
MKVDGLYVTGEELNCGITNLDSVDLPNLDSSVPAPKFSMANRGKWRIGGESA